MSGKKSRDRRRRRYGANQSPTDRWGLTYVDPHLGRRYWGGERNWTALPTDATVYRFATPDAAHAAYDYYRRAYGYRLPVVSAVDVGHAPGRRCRCGKELSFTSERAATNFLLQLWQRTARRRDVRRQERRAYRCELTDRWHLTSLEEYATDTTEEDSRESS